jgi:hypothetical protein
MLQSTTSTTTVSASSGAVCTKSGPYKSSRGANVTVVVQAGQLFPKDADGKNTTWSMTLRTETLTLLEM